MMLRSVTRLLSRASGTYRSLSHGLYSAIKRQSFDNEQSHQESGHYYNYNQLFILYQQSDNESESDGKSGYYSNYNPLFVLYCPAAVVAAGRSDKEENDEDEEDEKNEKNEKNEKKHYINGKYTFLQSDIDNIVQYIESKKQTRRVYPPQINDDQKLKNGFRVFINSKKWLIKPHKAVNVDRKLLYRKVTTIKEKKIGKIIKNIKANKGKSNTVKKEVFVRCCAEEELQFIWDKKHINNGHPGQDSQIKLLQNTYYIHRLVKWVLDNAAICEECIANHSNNKKRYRGPLQIVDAPFEPNSEFSIDLFGPVNEGYYGEKYGLCVRELSHAYLDIIPILSKEAPIVGDALHSKITLRNGGVVRYHSDNGKEFVNKLDDFMVGKWGYRHTTIIPGCPWQNGAAESGVKIAKRTINEFLQKMAENEGVVFNKNKWPAVWSLVCPEAEYLINIKRNGVNNISAIEYKLNKRIYGSYTPEDTDLFRSSSKVLSMNDLVEIHQKRHKDIDDIARATSHRRKLQIKANWDKKYGTDLIKIGTKVKWRERGKWLPKDGCVYIHAYTQKGNARLFDNLQNHVVSMPLSQVRPASKNDKLVTVTPSKWAKRYKKSKKSNHNNSSNVDDADDVDNVAEIEEIDEMDEDEMDEMDEINTMNEEENDIYDDIDDDIDDHIDDGIDKEMSLEVQKVCLDESERDKNKNKMKKDQEKREHLRKLYDDSLLREEDEEHLLSDITNNHGLKKTRLDGDRSKITKWAHTKNKISKTYASNRRKKTK